MIIKRIAVVQIITISIQRKVITIIGNCVPSSNIRTIYRIAALIATNPTALIINHHIALIITHAFTIDVLYLVN